MSDRISLESASSTHSSVTGSITFGQKIKLVDSADVKPPRPLNLKMPRGFSNFINKTIDKTKHVFSQVNISKSRFGNVEKNTDQFKAASVFDNIGKIDSTSTKDLLEELDTLNKQVKSASSLSPQEVVNGLSRRLQNLSSEIGLLNRDRTSPDENKVLLPKALDVLAQAIEKIGHGDFRSDVGKQILDNLQAHSQGKLEIYTLQNTLSKEHCAAPGCWPPHAQKKVVQLLANGAIVADKTNPEKYILPLIDNVTKLYASKGDRRYDVQGALLRGLEKTIHQYPDESKVAVRDKVLEKHKDFSTSPPATYGKTYRSPLTVPACAGLGTGAATGLVASVTVAASPVLWPVAVALGTTGIACGSALCYQQIRNKFRVSVQDRILTRVILAAAESMKGDTWNPGIKDLVKIRNFLEPVKTAADNGTIDGKYSAEINEYIDANKKEINELRNNGQSAQLS